MSDNSANNKRIAKNTLPLYFRMAITMLVGLYTSRVVLNALGVDDYGTYNVVGGLVAMFGILSGSLSTAISRFITFELGKGDLEKLKRIFCTSVNIQIILVGIIVVLMETVGIWFLNAKMVIPPERLYAANWVFQFSVVTFALGLLSVPYNAVIIAHEKMSAFAYISIIECLLKLIVALVIAYNPFDKLIYYGLLIMVVGVINRLIYGIYSKRHFEEATYHFIFDKGLMKEMFGFAGWNFFGNSAYMLYTQGVNIASNIFYGVTINAVRGIATQVEGVVKNFVNSFTTALNPQITKSYATGNNVYMYELVCKGAKYTFFMMLMLAAPFFFEAETILKVWLVKYPYETPLFIRLSLIGTMIDLLGNSLAFAVFATGKIKKYYLVIGPISLLVLPISCVLFAIGFPAYISYIVIIVIYSIIQIVRLYVARSIMNFPVKMYYIEVFAKIIPVTIIALIPPYLLTLIMDVSIYRTLINVVISALSVIVAGYFFGLGLAEKEFVMLKVRQFLKKQQTK